MDEKNVEPTGSPRGDRDRITVVLGWAAGVMAVAVLTAIVYVMVVGLTPKAPRTLSEQQIMGLEDVVKSDPKNVTAWSSLAQLLTSNGQYARARTAITEGRAAAGDKAAFVVEEGRLQAEQGQADEALKTLDKAVKKAEAERAAKKKALEEKGVVSKVESPEVLEAELIIARIHVKRSDWDRAIDAFGAALKEKPEMADVLVERGDAYVKVKRYDDARKDYEQALKYIPDSESALKGLKGLKAVGR